MPAQEAFLLNPNTNLPLNQRALSHFEVVTCRRELFIWVGTSVDERTHQAIASCRPAFWSFWNTHDQPFAVCVEVANVRDLNFACEHLATAAKLTKQSPAHFVERFLSRMAPANASGVATLSHMLIRHVGIFPASKEPHVIKPVER
jgi:hypothetical protein